MNTHYSSLHLQPGQTLTQWCTGPNVRARCDSSGSTSYVPNADAVCHASCQCVTAATAPEEAASASSSGSPPPFQEEPPIPQPAAGPVNPVPSPASAPSCPGTFRLTPNLGPDIPAKPIQDWCLSAAVDTTCQNGRAVVLGSDKYNVCKVNCKC